MKLYVIPDSVECELTKTAIAQNVEVVQLNKKEGKWFEGDEEFIYPIDKFPLLFIGIMDEKPNLLIGKETITSFFEKGYLYSPESKFCPYLNGNCKERDCVKFAVLYKGLIPEGACGDHWSIVLMTQLLLKLK